MSLIIDPKLWTRGLWFPAVVFLIHYCSGAIFPIYANFPDVDRLFHFIGGFSIAFATSGVLHELNTRKAITIQPTWLISLAALSVTGLATVLWEAYEFILNRYYDVPIQTSLDDTLYDLFLGVAGAIAFCFFSLFYRYATLRR